MSVSPRWCRTSVCSNAKGNIVFAQTQIKQISVARKPNVFASKTVVNYLELTGQTDARPNTFPNTNEQDLC